MNILEIAAMPTSVDKVHESIYRSYHILVKARELLKAGTPPNVVASLIDEMMEAPRVDGKIVNGEVIWPSE